MAKRIKKYGLLLCIILLLGGCKEKDLLLSSTPNDLKFTSLATTWDEGIPLGNGITGSLIWQKNDVLRMSLDHTGLWDLRPKRDYMMSRYNFNWVQEHVNKKDYKPVHDHYDVDTVKYPTKIPGAALEFNLKDLGKANAVQLYLNNAVCEVKWDGGAILQTFVHASENAGWFRFTGVPADFKPVLAPPNYQATQPLEPGSLGHLGYTQGKITENGTTIVYRQPGSNGFYYEIAVTWQHSGHSVTGVWAIRPKPDADAYPDAINDYVKKTLQQGFASACNTHNKWWQTYWAKSSVNIPDTILAKQYYNDMYKFGSVSRSYSAPISLQSVWTADDGKCPPWGGDYHHNLNTQLSYWPCYAGNRLEEGLGYLNWLWDIIPVSKKYTRDYFGVDGLNVGGVTTLKGEPMGTWIQYVFSPTVSAWLAQHFYLHWRYSQDKAFLESRVYPYLRDVAVFLDNITVRDENNKRKLPISASPEIYGNALKAWFLTTTNFDLALVRFLYSAAADCAHELGLEADEVKWRSILTEWPDYDLDADGALTFAKDFPYNESHRHFSNQMAIHPLGLIDWNNSEDDRKIITATIKKLDETGPRYWCGYSYSWLGNIKARAMDGEGAAKALRIFAAHFSRSNTFHSNGDYTRQGYSASTNHTFTLEGNFAFASAIHEMLMQSHTGVIRVFPAIPASWKDVSFDKLRAVGAFLVSAQLKDGSVSHIVVESEKGGVLRLAKPAEGNYREVNGKTFREENGTWIIEMKAGESVRLEQ